MEKYVGHLIDTINIQERFGIKVIAIKSPPEEKMLSSIFKMDYKVDLHYDTNKILIANDILIVAGRISDISKFVED